MTATMRNASAAAIDDLDLLERIHLGDREALGALYDRHAQALFGFLRRMLTREEAEDVVQATFVRIVEIAGSFEARAGDDARGWIFGVGYRVASERRRTLARLREVLSAFAASLSTRPPPADHEALDVERALSRLSEGKRAVLVLTQVHGFSSEEVARILDLPLGTVWTRLHHARRELKALLENAR